MSEIVIPVESQKTLEETAAQVFTLMQRAIRIAYLTGRNDAVEAISAEVNAITTGK